ncbi:MAG: class F sortase [Chloroflexota bacterium]
MTLLVTVPALTGRAAAQEYAEIGETVAGQDAGALNEAAVEFENGVPPVRIQIPSIGLDTEVVPVGLDPDGAMSAPVDPDTVAWYSLGPGLGIGGNIVLAGHVDWAGRPRVFAHLRNLSEGDLITIWDEKGDASSYFVESSGWVEAEGAPIEEIFGSRSESTITLITCGGTFDPFARQYLHRLVVRAQQTLGSTIIPRS